MEKIEALKGDTANLGELKGQTIRDLRVLSALLLLLPGETAYTERATEKTAAERLGKIEEALRDFVAQKTE